VGHTWDDNGYLTFDAACSYTYDAANRLTDVGGVAYTWDANGNLTSDGVRSYTYDHANRLTQVTEGSLTTQFAYNGDGVRTGKTVAGDTTEYALDLLATLPVVISDTDAIYLYGLDVLAQQQSEMLYYRTMRWAACGSLWIPQVT